jgi:type II secretory pathway predicted ATPase ExeA
MYQQFYGLSQLPFELSPDPAYLFLTARHREALSNLQYGLFSARAITVLIGEAGTGKTTLLRAALESERCRNVRCVSVNNPTLTRDEFVSMLAARFGFGAEARLSKTTFLSELEQLIRRRREEGEVTALVVDEAQSMSDELLEEVRLLANFETSKEKLLPLVLAGQPALRERLNAPALLQLKQRVALRCEIAPFNLSETASYMASRIKTAGGDPRRLFTREAVQLIHSHAAGIPRTVNVICDNALLAGMAVRRQPVDTELVSEVCRDFDLSTEEGHDEPAETAENVPGPDDSGATSDAAASGDAVSATAGDPPRTRMFTHVPTRGVGAIGSR